jgi:DtxR family Mn-dependent transcriptional regulator
MEHSFTEENYLKAIYKLSDGTGEVSTTELANALKIKSATVTDMLKKLSARKLIKYERYKGLRLTEKGRQVAVRVIRKHRLWELFLVEKLKFGWDEVHDIAEQLEHIQSDELINRLDELLGHPKADPHGDPIPDEHGDFSERSATVLAGKKTKVAYTIAGVTDDHPNFLKYLDKVGIGLGDKISIISIEPYDQMHQVSVNKGAEFFISESVARNILVFGK